MAETGRRRWFVYPFETSTHKKVIEYLGQGKKVSPKRIRCEDGNRRDLYECSKEDLLFFEKKRYDEVLIYSAFVQIQGASPLMIISVEDGLRIPESSTPPKPRIVAFVTELARSFGW